jgi:hypothetical protein
LKEYQILWTPPPQKKKNHTHKTESIIFSTWISLVWTLTVYFSPVLQNEEVLKNNLEIYLIYSFKFVNNCNFCAGDI